MAPETRRAIRGVLTDIDDTLSTHGHLHSGAYAALERIARRGQMGDPDFRTPGRLVRPHRAHVARRCRRRRKRRVLHVP
jgi:hypothetical protein